MQFFLIELLKSFNQVPITLTSYNVKELNVSKKKGVSCVRLFDMFIFESK